MADPNCKTCHGQGSYPISVSGPPVHKMCICTQKEEILRNAERGLRGLTQHPPVPSSPLMGKEDGNLWVTSMPEWFLPHLRHLAIRKPPQWRFKVVSDADLITAWLATAALNGAEILDPDARLDAVSVSSLKLTLPDIAVPPDLLIVRLGVKTARNVAMSEVFLEALRLREALSKPTWVWDQQDLPFREGHISYSRDGYEHIRYWTRIDSREYDNRPTPKPGVAKEMPITPSLTPTSGSIRDLFMRGSPDKQERLTINTRRNK